MFWIGRYAAQLLSASVLHEDVSPDQARMAYDPLRHPAGGFHSGYYLLRGKAPYRPGYSVVNVPICVGINMAKPGAAISGKAAKFFNPLRRLGYSKPLRGKFVCTITGWQTGPYIDRNRILFFPSVRRVSPVPHMMEMISFLF